jgi:hypothetical protein
MSAASTATRGVREGFPPRVRVDEDLLNGILRAGSWIRLHKRKGKPFRRGANLKRPLSVVVADGSNLQKRPSDSSSAISVRMR